MSTLPTTSNVGNSHQSQLKRHVSRSRQPRPVIHLSSVVFMGGEAPESCTGVSYIVGRGSNRGEHCLCVFTLRMVFRNAHSVMLFWWGPTVLLHGWETCSRTQCYTLPGPSATFLHTSRPLAVFSILVSTSRHVFTTSQHPTVFP